ncbi:MAG: hypothetical protein M3209_09540 [Acidobacteriota bacterium]|nr:hypothetical protein [Acidobacteriota bacterium]
MIQTATKTEIEQRLENAALLVNLWNGIELDVKSRFAARIAKQLVETHYRENDLPADFAFLESEAAKLGFSVAFSRDERAYIFRSVIAQYSGITTDDLEKHFRIHGAAAIQPVEVLCPICLYYLDEHPMLGTITHENGSRFLRLVARAMCSQNVLFEKAVEI